MPIRCSPSRRPWVAVWHFRQAAFPDRRGRSVFAGQGEWNTCQPSPLCVLSGRARVSWRGGAPLFLSVSTGERWRGELGWLQLRGWRTRSFIFPVVLTRLLATCAGI